MSKKNEKSFYEEADTGARFAHMGEDDFTENHEKDAEFFSRREMVFASIQNYWGKGKTMMASSLSHLRSPATIFVIMLLIALYIILGVAGYLEFSFAISENIREIKISLDIIVNALLGFFYGPVTCCISVTICCLVRMIATRQGFFIGYVVLSSIAGFLHGWILYKHKAMWFGTRFRGFFTDLLSKAIATRLVISVVVNIFLKAIMYKIFIKVPIYYTILHYSYSKVELESFPEFMEVFIAGFIVDTMIIFIALAVVNFIVSKAFPVQYTDPSFMIDENGDIINMEDEMMPE